MSFVPHVLPWDTNGFDRITINTTLGRVNKCKDPPTICRHHAEESLALIDDCDYAFWTDASVLSNHSSSSACIGYTLANLPTLAQTVPDHFDFSCSWPAGLVAASTEAENDALQLPPLIIAQHPIQFTNQRILIGADTASALSGLKTGPLYHPKCDNIPFSETLQMYRDVAVAANCTFLLQYVPAHVGLGGNTAVDLIAKSQAYSYPLQHQFTRSVSLRTIKCILKQSLHQQWLSQPLHATNCSHLLGNLCSHLKT